VEVKEMTVKRQKRNGSFKFKVALEAAKELKTVNQIASDYQVNPGQVSQWKKQLHSQGATIFQNQPAGSQQQQEKKEAELYEQIGRLKMELEWLKKKV
jgi:putative transposase